MAIVQQPQPQQQTMSWKDTAIAKSEIITDAWEVTKTYAGRTAEWVLFACMIMNILEILPDVHLWPLVSNIVLGVQVIMLDVGGFSLASMGDYARQQGDKKAARRAGVTGWFLIALMMLTLLLVAISILFPETKTFIDNAEKGLILVRVIMTVAYGHVIHSLRRAATNMQPAQNQVEVLTHQLTQQAQELTTTFNQQIQHLTAELSRMEQNFHQRLNESSTMVEQDLQNSLHGQLATELSSVRESLQHYQEVLAFVPSLQVQLQRIESSTTEELQRVKASLEKQLGQLQAEQSHEASPQKRAERPILRALPSLQQGSNKAKRLRVKDTRGSAPQGTAQEKFDARAFVFACLADNKALKLTEIQQLALAKKQELSEATISRHRKQFFESRESSPGRFVESSTTQGESPDESSDGSSQIDFKSSSIGERVAVNE